MSFRRQRNSQWKKFVFAFGITAVLFLSFYTAAPAALRNVVSDAAAPLWRGENAASGTVSEFLNFFRFKKDLLEENERLQEEVERLTALDALNRQLLAENFDLKRRLGRSDVPRARTLAVVLVGPGRGAYDTFFLDVGREHGVAVRDRVVAFGNVIIGEVTDVAARTSRAVLYSAPGQETPVLVGTEHIRAVAEGWGGSNYVISLPRELEIEEGSIVRLPGAEAWLLGVVGVVRKEPQRAEQELLFRIPINIQGLGWLEVVSVPHPLPSDDESLQSL